MASWAPSQEFGDIDDNVSFKYSFNSAYVEEDHCDTTMFKPELDTDVSKEENLSTISNEQFKYENEITKMIRRSGMDSEQANFKINSKTTRKNPLQRDLRIEMYGREGVYLSESFFKLEPIRKTSNVALPTLKSPENDDNNNNKVQEINIETNANQMNNMSLDELNISTESNSSFSSTDSNNTEFKYTLFSDNSSDSSTSSMYR